MNQTGRPTLADVASRAGVSLKTASRALNGEYGVSEATAGRVRDAARELGFRPNHLARSLAAGTPSAAVGLVISSVSDPFIAAISGAVEEVLAPRDLQLLSASHGDDPDRQRRIVRTFVERRLDALIVVPAPGDASYLQSEIDHRVDGKPAQLWRANYLFQALRLPAGEHQIILAYHPLSFWGGAALSLVSLLAAIIIFIRLRRPATSQDMDRSEEA